MEICVMAHKPEIKIKKSHEGRFTEYCKRKGYKSATSECEEEGLASKSAKVRKMANFSKNAKSWNH